MERNDLGNDGLASGTTGAGDTGATNIGAGNIGSTGNDSGANEFSGGATQRDNSFDFSGSAGATEQSQNLKDRARSVIGSAGSRLADVGSTVRERAGTAKDRLADALESGAERLRSRAGGAADATLAGATGAGSTAIANDGRVAQISDRVAGGMERSAEWLRDADIDGLKTSIEEQVKEHPGRTLLIAVGLGYLIGRAFRSNQ